MAKETTFMTLKELKDFVKPLSDENLIEISIEDEEGIEIELVKKGSIKFNKEKRTVQIGLSFMEEM